MNNNTYHIFFTNLANPLKIEIIVSLKKREKNVTELSKELKIEQSKVSHALASLRCCNIVKVKQKGKQRIYFLNKDTIIPMLKLIDKHAKTFCKECCCKECKK
ncbi:winged helix-turn-helix transcriptional regulator [Candidatus Pacearchaeota archaeon]|nr:winged helix-turn-helix transcriptional regulator [Candidatus Pacearchaeota archaeon]